MIYLKNNTETQSIYIPRQTVLGGGYIATTKTYEDGLAEGIERGKEIQKGQLLNLYVTENGEYEREDGWGAITVNIPREECPEGGSCNLGIGEYGFDTNTVGDYELYASDDGYDGWSKMFIHIYGDSGAIRVQRASDLLDSFNNDNGAGLDYGWNYYVGGIITEKQEFNTEYDYATYILDNGFKIYRGKWLNGDSFLGEDPIKLGAYAIVYGVLQDNNGELGLEEGSQVVAYQECAGGSCNLEDKSVTPSMSDRDNNGLIVVNPSEGYDGLSRTVIDPQTLYNEGVEAGKTEKETDIAKNARVLNVTENGVYRTKFSDPIMPTTVTGVYADGTEFYNYAELNGKVFNTNIPATMDSRVELWYKGDNIVSGDGYNNIIATNDTDNSNIFEIIYWASNNDEVRARIGSSQISANWDETKWHHIIVSVSDGFVIDGEKKGDIQSNSNIPNGRFMINGIYNLNSLRNANGCYGMIKIDNVVIIPTADGFKNVNTAELLEVVQDGGYTFTENVPIYGEGELYKTINVNVPTEAVSCNLEDKQITPSTNDVDDNGHIVINPNNGYDAMSRVTIDVSTIKSEWTTIGENSILGYYWCPLTVSDGGIGERAKYFSLADEQTVYDENDVLISRNDMFYLPTANNLNEFRLTKKAVKIVFPFKNEDAQHIGNLYLNDDVEQFACADKNLSSLSIIEVGINMMRFTLSNCNLLNLNKIVVHSNNNCDVTLTHNVKSTGTLYVNESNQFKNNWINALPSGWTVEYI